MKQIPRDRQGLRPFREEATAAGERFRISNCGLRIEVRTRTEETIGGETRGRGTRHASEAEKRGTGETVRNDFGFRSSNFELGGIGKTENRRAGETGGGDFEFRIAKFELKNEVPKGEPGKRGSPRCDDPRPERCAARSSEVCLQAKTPYAAEQAGEYPGLD